MTPIAQRDGQAIQLVGFDGDDTLWKSEDYYRTAEADFEAILSGYLIRPGFPRHLKAMENGRFGGVYEQQ
ncbi:hypothetical protein VDG03_19250, partial [Xanthomonas campestris pv. raphani]|nr:hypothetical protein [Xanthomonas campestris pv. raphani]MEA9813336.1 hypothetical protein [Xanthomonas campestris pv. raphani]